MITTILIAAEDTPTEISPLGWVIIIGIAIALIGGGSAGGGRGR